MILLAAKLARRELRGGIKGLRIVLACLALGVAAIAGVGSLRIAIEAGLTRDGSRVLGGDLEIEGGSQPLPDTLRTWLHDRGARTSDVVTTRSMLVAASGERQLVELKAVDGAWPLIGQAIVDPPQAAVAPGVAVERIVMDRLALKPGDTVRLGDAKLVVRGVLTEEPDRVSGLAVFGARALVDMADLARANLLQPGALANYHLRLLLPPGANPVQFTADIRTAFPNTGWRIRNASDAAPGVVQFIDRTSLFMTLVGLSALLVGGIGVANGVKAWLEARARTIATLRCLGAAPRLVFLICLLQVMALAAVGVIIGVVAGALLPWALGGLLRGILPVPPIDGVYPRPLALAALFGMLTAGVFALWPLSRAMLISGAGLFRDAILPTGVRPPASVVAGTVALAAALVGLTVLTSPQRGFALGFSVAAIATLLLFAAGGWAVVRLAALAPRPRAAWARLGLGNLHRPGTGAPLLLVSLGLGLSTLAALALIEGNLRHQIADQLPADAPSFYFIDIQNEQMATFNAVLARDKNVREVREVPSLRARVVAVNGVPAEQVHTTPDTAWALRGDRGLTYAAAEPEGTRLVAGDWWPANYDGPPLVSFDASIARGWGVKLGDIIRVNVLGRDIDLKVASLRDIAWRSLGLNFAMVASPGLLEHAPHMHIATVKAPPSSEGTLLREVTDALPNVTGIRVSDVLKAIGDLLGQLATALAATGSITLAAGALVLAGAVAAGQRRRIADAVILKSLGATRGQISAAWLLEFGVLGLAAGVLACLVGSGASYAVTHFVMGTDWTFLPGTLALTVVGCIVLMLGFGYLGTAAALRVKAAPLLRNE